MKKFLTFFIAGLLLSSVSFANGVWITQTSNTKDASTLFSDDMETYTAGDAFVANANQTWWTTWTPGSTSEDAVVSSDYAHSGVNSVKFIPNDDVILKFGDRASGKYEISFWIYVEAGQGGAYFNLQKWEVPGTEWAFNCTFNDNGTGNLQYLNQDHAFSFSTDAWVEIRNVVNLDDDIYEMFIDGNLSDTHQYSATAIGGLGVKRLGCIDFYGNTGNDFYIDDVSVIELIPSQPPIGGVDVTQITSDGTANSTIVLENTGVENLNFSVYPTYPSSKNSKSNKNKKSVQLRNSNKNTKDNVTLSLLTGDVGYFTYASPGQRLVKEIVKFTPQQLNTFGAIGTVLQSVICFIGDTQLDGTPITDFKLVVYDREDLVSPGPGSVIQEQAFTPAGEQNQTVVTLDNPVYIDGRDLWFGFEFTDPGYSATDTVFALSYDGNVNGMVQGSNWLSLGVGWRTDIGGNLGVIGNALGTPTTTWLSCTPSTGSVLAGQNQNITVSFNLQDLQTGEYNANVSVATNDPANPFFDIPVTLNAVIVGVNDVEKSGIMTYPNPVKDIFNIVSNNLIENVSATNIAGQTVLNKSVNTKSYKLDLTNLAKGIYMFNIKTKNQTITRKVIVE